MLATLRCGKRVNINLVLFCLIILLFVYCVANVSIAVRPGILCGQR